MAKKQTHLNLKGFLSFLILHELGTKSLAGDDLSIKIGQRRGSPLTPGTIYPTLKALRKAKLVSYKRYGRKKMYTLTDLGTDELDYSYGQFAQYFAGLSSIISRKGRRLKQKTTKKKSKTSKQKSKISNSTKSSKKSRGKLSRGKPRSSRS